MRKIQIPPKWMEILKEYQREVLELLVSPELKSLLMSSNEKYLHWDQFMHLPMPENIKPELAWICLKISRLSTSRQIPIVPHKGRNFQYWLPDCVLKELHFLDQYSSGQLLSGLPFPTTIDHEAYVINSLMEEAIASSLLEGAATTRKKAKDMLRTGRMPRNKAEQMILNNYLTMRKIKDLTSQPLSIEMLCEIQSLITNETLDDDTATGRLRKPDEEIVIIDRMDGQVLHFPPVANELPARLQKLCNFANQTTEPGFIHPIIKGIILHFWLAYEHPFVDGNGRTARALFYWYLMKQKYWLFEYIPLSRIILRSPARYARAFLYSETDEGDVTYFIHFNLRALRFALEDFISYIERKQREVYEIGHLLKKVRGLNKRQFELLNHALHHPEETYTFIKHKTTHGISYQTARTDLLGLAKKGYLQSIKRGKTVCFIAREDLAHRLKFKTIPSSR